MMYSAIDIADYIIISANKKNIKISNLKLQKLLYYVQAASLVFENRPIFSDKIQAWKYGPVVEEVYHTFKVFANDAIEKPASEFSLSFILNKRHDEEIEDRDKELIDRVVDSYKDYSAIKIMKKTHSEAPWKETFERTNKIISHDIIQSYYSENQGEIYGQEQK